MAVYVQPYNPWKEQAALSLLGGFIDRLQQTEQNRKTNAFRGQLQQNLANQTGANDNISLMPQNVPQGYNDNPWASAFHKTDSPLTQFNIGTAGSMARLPTMSEIANMGASLGASKRFSGLNPDTVQKIIAEMSQANEMQRMTDLRRNYAQQLGQAGSWDDWFKILTQGNIEGVTSADALKHGADYSQFRQPHQIGGVYNAGGHGQAYSFDPLTGKMTPQQAFAHSLSPDTALENQTKIDVANIAASADFATANAKNAEWHFKSIQEVLKNEQTNLEQAISEYQSMDFKNDEQRQAFYNSRIAPIKQKIEAYQSELIKGIAAYSGAGVQTTQNTQNTQSPNFKSSANLAFDALGNGEGLRISKNGHFGAARKGHSHAGIDVAVPVGTPVRVTSNMGQELIVTRADNKDATGYGNLVILETNLNGHKIQYYFGHLDNDSYSHLKVGQKVKPGDIIAKSGNTGRSSGPHLHFEVRVDGKPTDPAAFLQNFGGFSAQGNSQSGTNAQNNTQTQQNTSTQSPKNDNIPSNSNAGNSGGIFARGGDTDNAPAYVKGEQVITKSQLKALEKTYGTDEARRQLEAQGFFPSENNGMPQSLMPAPFANDVSLQPTEDTQNTTTTPTPNNEKAQYIPQDTPINADISGSQSLMPAPFANDVSVSQIRPSQQLQQDLTIDDMVNYFWDLGANFDNWMMPATSNPAGFDSAFGQSIPVWASLIRALSKSKNKSIPIELQTANEFRDLQNFYAKPTAPAYQNNFNDKNRRNSAYVPTGSPYQTLNPWNLGEAINYVKSMFNRFSTQNEQNNFNPYVPLHMRSAYPTSADDNPQASEFTPFSSRYVAPLPMHIRQMQDNLTVGDMANYIQSMLNQQNDNMNATLSNPYAQLLMRSGLTPTPDTYNPQNFRLFMSLLWPNLTQDQQNHMFFMRHPNPQFKGGN